MKNITNKEKCCGCMACVNICPKGAINIKVNKEGFSYPEIDEDKCIECGLCKNTCPANQYAPKINTPKAYAAYSLDNKIRLNSSSGGVFAFLAMHILSLSGSVYGVTIIDNEAKHIKITNENGLKQIMGSKYVQSDTENTYKQVKQDILDEKHVLFSGTPCQIAGLYNYLSNFKTLNMNLLYTVEVVCHGVPSPKVFKKYISEKENKYGSNVQNINFRDKTRGWENYNINIQFKNKKKYTKKFNEDIYMRTFLKDIALRYSCYDCNFNGLNRVADITLGDYWGVQYKYKHLADNKGISLVLVNSNQGGKILENIKSKIYIESTDLDYAIQNNPCIIKSVPLNKNRHNFFNDLDTMSLDMLQDKYYKYEKVKTNYFKEFLHKIKRKYISLKR